MENENRVRAKLVSFGFVQVLRKRAVRDRHAGFGLRSMRRNPAGMSRRHESLYVRGCKLYHSFGNFKLLGALRLGLGFDLNISSKKYTMDRRCH